mmetsp:Transcript_1652/g.3601  ORF Transcript_1652/g.3601 Transcript_1652/m.3601 type:complete len:311 (+) Transcript_1652:400-1332(+)
MGLLHDFDGLLSCGLGEFFKAGGAQLMSPGFEYLNNLRAAFDLVDAIVANHGGELVKEVRHGLGIARLISHHHLLGGQTRLGGLALDSVGGKSERGTDKANERCVGVFGLLREATQNLPDEGKLVIKIDVIGIAELGNILLGEDLRGNHRSSSLDDVEVNPQRRQRRQNVGEHDNAIHSIRPMALQTQLDGKVGSFRSLAEGVLVGVFPEGGHVPACLPHQPDGGALDLLAAGGTDQDVAISWIGRLGGGGGRGGLTGDGRHVQSGRVCRQLLRHAERSRRRREGIRRSRREGQREKAAGKFHCFLLWAG